MFGSNKRQGTAIAVFDVSSSSVGGAHALVHPHTKDVPSTLLASLRVEGPLQEDINMKRFVSDTVHSIETVAIALRKADMHHPSHIELVLASPWYVSQTRTVTYKQDTPFLCTSKLVAKLVDQEIAQVIAHELDRFGAYGKEGTVVEKQVSLIRLNGYATGDPFGKKAKTIELYLTITIVPKQIVDEFTEAIRRTYGTRTISITTSPYATFVVARDFFNKGHECVVIDVGEEVTDIGFVKNGLFTYQYSFPVGTYSLYRLLTGKGGHTPVEAAAMIEAYRLEKLSVSARSSIEKAIATFSTDWQNQLQQAFQEGHYGFCLPETCFITADVRFEAMFPAIISNDPFIQQTCSRGPVNPVFIGESLLAPFITSLDTSYDASLATAVLFVERTISTQ